MTTVTERPTPPANPWPVTADRVLTGSRADSLYEIYLESFRILQSQAAARHVLHRDEFLAEMADPRITKYTVWRTDSVPIALATVTTDLDAVAWISPEFFALRHPAQAARQAIHYLGFVLVAPGRGQYRLLERVVEHVIRPCLEEKGVLAYDVCAFNNRTVAFGRRAEAILHRMGPVEVGEIDTQTYYEAVFT